MLKRRMCTICNKYHSSIKAMKAHKQYCKSSDKVQDETGDDDEEEEEEEDGDDVDDDVREGCATLVNSTSRNIFDTLNDIYNI